MVVKERKERKEILREKEGRPFEKGLGGKLSSASRFISGIENNGQQQR